MSHFTYIKTRFQNLFYLEKSLNRLNVSYKYKLANNSNVGIIIPQSNKHDVEFLWNGKEYQLKVDIPLWKQKYSVESFIDKISQQYAGEVIIGESQKLGFQPIQYKQNSDGSNTLVLERWNNK